MRKPSNPAVIRDLREVVGARDHEVRVQLREADADFVEWNVVQRLEHRLELRERARVHDDVAGAAARW